MSSETLPTRIQILVVAPFFETCGVSIEYVDCVCQVVPNKKNP
jgi:hypothetical protein